MLFYPYEVVRVARDTVEVSFPQFPMICAYSYNAETALRYVQETLFAVIDARISAGLPVPAPIEGEHVVPLPLELTLKLSLYWEMSERGMDQAELALELGVGLEGLEAIFSADEEANRSRFSKRAAAMALAEVDARSHAYPRHTPSSAQCGRVAAWPREIG